MCLQRVNSNSPLVPEMLRGSATSAAAIMHDDTIFWEELVEQDRQTVLVTAKLQAGAYQGSQGAQISIPAMPVLPVSSNDPESQTLHRDKLVHRTNFESAMVARKVGRTEMMDIENARQAMIK